MEDLYGWLIVFAGAMIGYLGAILFTSERELKNKKRECEELRANQAVAIRERATEVRPSETQTSAELTAKNKELADQISALSGRLEESQQTVDELQEVQRRFVGAQAEESQVQETIRNLRSQLGAGEIQLNESNRRHQEATVLTSKLQSEVVQLQEQLQENRKSEEKLRTEQQRLLVETQAESQKMCAANQEQQQEIANLRKQLQTSEELVSQSARQHKESADREFQLQSELGELREQLAKLATDKQDLLDQIESLSGKLSASERSIEEFQVTHQDTQFETDQLRVTNQELQRQTSEIAERLNASETRLGELSKQRDEAAARCTELQAEIVDVKRQAEESQAKAGEIESLRRQIADFESRELIFREGRHELQARITDLQRECATEKEKAQEFEAVRQRLRDEERVCQELRDQNRRFEGEIESLRERLAANEKAQREITELRGQLEELRVTKAPLSDKNQPLQMATHTVQLTQEAIEPEEGRAIEMAVETSIVEVDASTAHHSEDSGDRRELIEGAFSPGVQSEKAGAARLRLWDSGKRNWRSGWLTAAVILGIGCVVGFLATQSSGSKDPAVVSESIADEPPAPVEKASIVQETKPPHRVRGAFRITRPTQVYSGPSEYSAQIANIATGMKINVVDSRDGWLEIRSKHGRPPGFVRQEDAVRINQ